MRKITPVLVALTALACGDSPAKPSPPAATPAVFSIEIFAPAAMVPGTTAQLFAQLRLQDGTSRPATAADSIRWFSAASSVVQVAPSGLATTSELRGESRVTALYGTGNQTRSASRLILVLPEGTFRLIGSVKDAEATTLALDGARVEVTSEVDLATTTNTAGEYRLYGVPPNAVIQVSRTGYTPITQAVQLTGHASRDFELGLSGSRFQLSGEYTVVMDMPGSCSSGTGLDPNLRRRVYEATVTQSGPVVEVVLTEPRFRINNVRRGNRFTGYADATGVRFAIEPYNDYYYPSGINPYPSIAELLPDGTVLVPYGEAIVTGNSNAVSGGFNASFGHYDKSFPSALSAFLGGCTTPLTQLTLTRR